MSRFEHTQNAVAELVAELAHAEELCDEQSERIAAVEGENRHLREALILALKVIDPEQHDVIEEGETTLHGDLDDAVTQPDDVVA